MIHFTYGDDFNEQGVFTPGKVGHWHWDKRDWTVSVSGGVRWMVLFGGGLRVQRICKCSLNQWCSAIYVGSGGGCCGADASLAWQCPALPLCCCQPSPPAMLTESNPVPTTLPARLLHPPALLFCCRGATLPGTSRCLPRAAPMRQSRSWSGGRLAGWVLSGWLPGRVGGWVEG